MINSQSRVRRHLERNRYISSIFS